MFPPQRNELHVSRTNNGHKLSTDCWCEPTSIYWRVNEHGIRVLIVEHEDIEPPTMHHDGVLYARDMVEDWISQLLNSIDTSPPPGLNDKELP